MIKYSKEFGELVNRLKKKKLSWWSKFIFKSMLWRYKIKRWFVEWRNKATFEGYCK